MAFTNAEAREQLLDALAEAVDRIGLALACLGEAYELLDETTGDRLEEQLFRPVQTAYGRAKRTHADFAGRYDLPGQEFVAQLPGVASQGTKVFVEKAVDATRMADDAISALQDSMLPVEFGDAQFRAGLSEVRVLLGPVSARAREFVRTLGR